MKIDTDDYDVIDLSVAEARGWIDGKEPAAEVQEDIEAALDEAQGDVLTGKKDEAYVIIRIRP